MPDQSLLGAVAILSPHLDDAVLSLGAAIARATTSGAAEVRIVTVFGGDPQSTADAGAWDRRAGFASEGEAARARRVEDRRACDILGASTVPLPFGDRQYPPRANGDTIWSALENVLRPCDAVLVPGFPLAHEDHAWLASFFWSRWTGGIRAGVYVEQPYATQLVQSRGQDLDRLTWIHVDSTPTERLRKFSACRAYRSQLPLLGGPEVIAAVLAAEARHGERIQWVQDRPPAWSTPR